MSLAYTPKDAAIDAVAVALILAPEPATTAIGVSLLLRKRGAAKGATPEAPARLAYPEYQYRMETIRGRKITWEVHTTMPGQLPLREINKPSVQIKPRINPYIYMSSEPKPEPKLPAGVRVHHELHRPSPSASAWRNAFIPGETIHHTLRGIPQGPVVKKDEQYIHTHHRIENSPGYIKAQSGRPAIPGDGIIHHTMKDAPGAQHGNPAKIVKPVRIVEHHQLNKTPQININGHIVRPPSLAPRKPIIGERSRNLENR